MDVIELEQVDLLSVHRAALKQYEADAAECDANDEPITAQMFREAAERRRKLLEKLEQQSNEQEKEQTKDEGNNPSQLG